MNVLLVSFLDLLIDILCIVGILPKHYDVFNLDFCVFNIKSL